MIDIRAKRGDTRQHLRRNNSGLSGTQIAKKVKAASGILKGEAQSRKQLGQLIHEEGGRNRPSFDDLNKLV